MVILAVDNQAARLEQLADHLRAAFPTAEVAATADPLMAGKHAYLHGVDMLFAELVMRRMDGLEMARFVRRINPAARVYLIACEAEYGQALILAEDDIDGLLVRPEEGYISREALLAQLWRHYRARTTI